MVRQIPKKHKATLLQARHAISLVQLLAIPAQTEELRYLAACMGIQGVVMDTREELITKLAQHAIKTALNEYKSKPPGRVPRRFLDSSCRFLRLGEQSVSDSQSLAGFRCVSRG